MKNSDIDDSQLLELLETAEPVEPRGWFRWLHNHYMGRYGNSHPDLINGEMFNGIWGKASDKPEPLFKRIGTPEQWVAILNRNAWAAGMGMLIQTVGTHWAMLDREARGAFFAGISERDPNDLVMEKALEKLPDMAFSPESFCQLACNAIKVGKLDLLEAMLTKYPSPTDKIARLSISSPPDSWESEELKKVSHRVIDMILEAALIMHYSATVKLALEHGADPDIPIWQLERSYNRKYSALGYAIDSEYMQDSEPHSEITELLLDHGASASGIAYVGYNSELFQALGKFQHGLAERLISKGASLVKYSRPDGIGVTRTAGSESIVIGPGGPNFFGHFGDRLKWAHENIGSIIPLVSVSEKQAFFSSNGQGGSKSTMMDKVVGDVERLKRFEALGLDTRLSAEELCTAVSAGAFDSLVYLLSKHGDSARDRAMFRIRRYKTDIGASWRHMDVLPQEDGVNIATEFKPHDLEPFALPDGSKLHVDLSAIATPGHNLGPCFAGHFWLRTDTVILRRRKDKVIVRRLEKQWGMEPLPLRKPGTCSTGQHYLDDCLPLIREISGRFINLGMTLHGISHHLPECELKKSSTPWRDLPAYVALLDQAEKLIRDQVEWNREPGEPVLSEVELWGYPPEFWSYLVRLENGFIAMTPESCGEKPSLLKDYRVWARKAKQRERDFKPDPKLLEWEHWPEVPTDYRPYLYIDTMFNSRVSVIGGDYYKKYEHAMSEKIKNWLWRMEQKWKQK